MRYPVLIITLSIMLLSCGISYSVPRATLHIDLIDANQMDMMRGQIGSFLTSKDFEDLGKDEEMLALLEWSSRKHGNDSVVKIDSDSISRIHRTRHFTNKVIEIDVMIIDYSDTTIKKRLVNYPASETEITDSPSIELNIYNYRPGGFSVEAHRFYEEMYSFLKSKSNAPIHTVFSPPATDQKEYYKISAVNLLSGALWWLVVYLMSISLVGFLMIKILNRTNLAVAYKRTAFALFGTILATPLPFPAATILVVILPSILAIPAIGSDYFVRIQNFAIPSFIVSAVLCVVISIYFIRGRKSESI